MAFLRFRNKFSSVSGISYNYKKKMTRKLNFPIIRIFVVTYWISKWAEQCTKCWQYLNVSCTEVSGWNFHNADTFSLTNINFPNPCGILSYKRNYLKTRIGTKIMEYRNKQVSKSFGMLGRMAPFSLNRDGSEASLWWGGRGGDGE